MQRRIILLNSGKEAPFFRSFLKDRNPALDIVNVSDLAALETALAENAGGVRLISFLTNVIIPKRVLEQLSITPYNIHPAPPEYPGSHPESWAIWEQSPHYGVTAHEITERVDAGPIVATLRYDMPAAPQRLTLNDYNYGEALKVFAVVAAHCAKTDEPMARMNERWGKIKRNRKNFTTLCQATAAMNNAELARFKSSLR